MAGPPHLSPTGSTKCSQIVHPNGAFIVYAYTLHTIVHAKKSSLGLFQGLLTLYILLTNDATWEGQAMCKQLGPLVVDML